MARRSPIAIDGSPSFTQTAADIPPAAVLLP